MKNSELRIGDRVRLTQEKEAEITIKEIQSYTMIDENGKSYRNADGTPSYVSDTESTWTVELIERPVRTPVHWPPQSGDVWRTRDGEEYHFIDGCSFPYLSGKGGSCHSIGLTKLLSGLPVLVYRKGNAVR